MPHKYKERDTIVLPGDFKVEVTKIAPFSGVDHYGFVGFSGIHNTGTCGWIPCIIADNFIERNRIIIDYYVQQHYGVTHEYVSQTPPGPYKIIQQLTGRTTITPAIRELIRDLTGGMISFNLIHK